MRQDHGDPGTNIVAAHQGGVADPDSGDIRDGVERAAWEGAGRNADLGRTGASAGSCAVATSTSRKCTVSIGRMESGGYDNSILGPVCVLTCTLEQFIQTTRMDGKIPDRSQRRLGVCQTDVRLGNADSVVR
jgi:hypothetical protein